MTGFNSTMHIVLWLQGNLPQLCNEFGQTPSFEKLAKLKPCGVCTIRKAMRQLETEGFLITKRGHGTFLLNHQAPFSKSIDQATMLLDTKKTRFQNNPLVALLLPVTIAKNARHKYLSEYLSHISSGITQAANEKSCSLSIHFYELGKPRSDISLNKFIRFIKNNQCATVLLASISEKYVIDKIAQTGVPGIMIDHWAPTSTNWSSILPNHYQATREMVLVLAQLKHKKIILIDRYEASLNPEILNGYKSGLRTAGLNYDKNLVFNLKNNDTHYKNKLKKVFKNLKSKDPATALIVQPFETTPRLIQSLSQEGFKVPEDISITTFGPKMESIKHLNLAGSIVDWVGMGQRAIEKALESRNENYRENNIEYFDMDFLAGSSIAYLN